MACIIALTYVIVVCFQLNLIDNQVHIGVQYRAKMHLFLYQRKPTKYDLDRFKKFWAIEQTLTRIRACKQLRNVCEHEQASTPLLFASTSSKSHILRALENFKGPFDTPNIPPSPNNLLNTI